MSRAMGSSSRLAVSRAMGSASASSVLGSAAKRGFASAQVQANARRVAPALLDIIACPLTKVMGGLPPSARPPRA